MWQKVTKFECWLAQHSKMTNKSICRSFVLNRSLINIIVDYKVYMLYSSHRYKIPESPINNTATVATITLVFTIKNLPEPSTM